MKKVALKWELIGIICIVILGSMLHFVFGWSGQWRPLAFIAAVNESVWEHLKLGFWPAVLYFLIEYRYIRRSTKNFLFAKTTGIYLIPIVITVLFYSYTAFIEDMLAADILIFVLAVVIGQLVSYRILSSRPLPRSFHRFAIVALSCLVLIFALFTFYPPHLPIFRDPISGVYGIPEP